VTIADVEILALASFVALVFLVACTVEVVDWVRERRLNARLACEEHAAHLQRTAGEAGSDG
jgi:hypothetical protein